MQSIHVVELNICVVVTPDSQILDRKVGATTQGLMIFVVFARGHSETSHGENNEIRLSYISFSYCILFCSNVNMSSKITVVKSKL